MAGTAPVTRENVLEAVKMAFNAEVIDDEIRIIDGRAVGSVSLGPSRIFESMDGIRRQARLWENVRKMFGRNSIKVGPIMLVQAEISQQDA